MRVTGWGLGFGVWGLGFGVWGLGFGVWGLGFVRDLWREAKVEATRRVWSAATCEYVEGLIAVTGLGFGFGVYGLWFMVYGSWFMVCGACFMVYG